MVDAARLRALLDRLREVDDDLVVATLHADRLNDVTQLREELARHVSG